jgi:hypothetical protein
MSSNIQIIIGTSEKRWHRKEKYHVCNPSYSGGRDQEDHNSRTAWQKVSKTPS